MISIKEYDRIKKAERKRLESAKSLSELSIAECSIISDQFREHLFANDRGLEILDTWGPCAHCDKVDFCKSLGYKHILKIANL